MAVIPTGVSNMVSSTVSWLITILTVLVIVKIVQLARSAFGGLGGGSGGSGGSGSSGRDTTGREPRSKREKDTRTKAEKAKDKEANRVAKDKFDPYNPAEVRFLVTDEDDNGIQDVKITVEPAFARTNKVPLIPKIGKFNANKNTWRKYGPFFTNQNGFHPSIDEYIKIGSGTLKIKAFRDGYLFPDSLNQKYYELEKGDKKIIVLTMQMKGEKDQFFEPHIKNVTIGKNKEGKNVLKLEAVIK